MSTVTLPDVLSRAARDLTAKGLPARYSATPAGVHALDVCLGPSARHRGHRTHCAFQVLDPGLGLYLCYDRDGFGRPLDDHRLPQVSPALDRTITYTLMPVLNTVLNPFDPAGRGQSVVVGCWHGRPTLTDLLLIPVTATRLLRTFAGDGQLALIWTDFKAPLAGLVTRLARLLTRERRVHLLPRTDRPSATAIPVGDGDGGYVWLTDQSDAVDAAIRLAHQYLSPSTREGQLRRRG